MKPYPILLLILMLFSSCVKREFILYSTSQSGNSDIFLLDLEDRELIAIANTEFEEWAPSLRADGSLTYLMQKGDSIFRMEKGLFDMKGRRIAHPTNCILDDKNVLYSPDGKWELYACKGDIFVSEIGGKEFRNLTEDMEGEQFKPVWFPNSHEIAFTTNHKGNQEIFKMNLEGKELVNLTRNAFNDEAPDISPDGKFMAFSSNRDGSDNQEIYVMNLEDPAVEVERITETPGWELIARWSTNGKWLYYGSNQNGNWDIFRHRLGTDKHEQLTVSEEFDGDPRPLRLRRD
ncbi:MAG: hypothetical protein MRZ79_26120 [Bacteroidia bacterium]|nr:hypothetical protein [Bacteroidia bacterium]